MKLQDMRSSASQGDPGRVSLASVDGAAQAGVYRAVPFHRRDVPRYPHQGLTHLSPARE